MIRNHFQNLAVFLSDCVTANLHGKSNYFQPLVFVNKQTIQYVNKGNHDSDKYLNGCRSRWNFTNITNPVEGVSRTKITEYFTTFGKQVAFPFTDSKLKI